MFVTYVDSVSSRIPLLALAALGLGCAREPECIPWQDVEITRSGPDVTEADVAAVQEEMAQMAEWTGLEEVCLQRVQVVGPEHAERLFEHTDWIGRFNSGDGGQAYVSAGPELRRITRHELCHAVDATLGWPSMERESPLVEGVRTDATLEAAREAFARVCEEGPGRATFWSLVAEGCSTSEPGADWELSDEVDPQAAAWVEKMAFPPYSDVWALGTVSTRTRAQRWSLPRRWLAVAEAEGLVQLDAHLLRAGRGRAAFHVSGMTHPGELHRKVFLADVRQSEDAPRVSWPSNYVGRADTEHFEASSVADWQGQRVFIAATEPQSDFRVRQDDRLEPTDALTAGFGHPLDPWEPEDALWMVEAAWGREEPLRIGRITDAADGGRPLWRHPDAWTEQTTIGAFGGDPTGLWLLDATNPRGDVVFPTGGLAYRRLRADGTTSASTPLPGARVEARGNDRGTYDPRTGTLLINIDVPVGWADMDSVQRTLVIDPDEGTAGLLDTPCAEWWSVHTPRVVVGEGGVLAYSTVSRAPAAFAVDMLWIEPDL